MIVFFEIRTVTANTELDGFTVKHFNAEFAVISALILGSKTYLNRKRLARFVVRHIP